jgi:hypothetical protein
MKDILHKRQIDKNMKKTKQRHVEKRCKILEKTKRSERSIILLPHLMPLKDNVKIALKI